jgi:hypothetical protein
MVYPINISPGMIIQMAEPFSMGEQMATLATF